MGSSQGDDLQLNGDLACQNAEVRGALTVNGQPVTGGGGGGSVADQVTIAGAGTVPSPFVAQQLIAPGPKEIRTDSAGIRIDTSAVPGEPINLVTQGGGISAYIGFGTGLDVVSNDGASTTVYAGNLGYYDAFGAQNFQIFAGGGGATYSDVPLTNTLLFVDVSEPFAEIGGLAVPPSFPLFGQVMIVNRGPAPLVLVNQSLSSLVGQRFSIGRNITIPAFGGVVVQRFIDGVFTAWGCVGQSQHGTGLLTVSNQASPATLDLTLEGTIDWFTMVNTGQRPKNIPAANYFTKYNGGQIGDTFEFILAGVGALGGQAGQIPSRSADPQMSTGGPLLSNTNATFVNVLSALASSVGFGYRFRFPARPTKQILELYTAQYSCDITCEVSLSDGSAPVAFDTSFAAASVNASRQFTVEFRSASPAAELNVLLRATQNNHDPTNNLNVGFIAATVHT